MASPKALWDWCRVTCANYPGVDIKNTSTSFKDGLAFCAIIHKHRPDLIDFNSLSKDNVYENNKLAYEVAETKLGIPALLDPKDMVSTKVPDHLSIISYLSQYYYFFSRKSCAAASRSRSSHVVVLNSITKSNKTPYGQARRQSLTDLETSKEDRFSYTMTRTVCSLCFKPVHLIQRRLVDGKAYHRSCFRCKVCLCTLLPGSYTQGSDTGSLICTYHVTDSKTACRDITHQIRSTDNRPKWEVQAAFHSLDGVAIIALPHYTQTTESQDRLPSVKERTVEEAENKRLAPIVADIKVQQNAAKVSELSSPCARVAEGSTRPVPAPRRSLNSSAVPVPAPRAKTAQTMSDSPAEDSQSKSPAGSTHVTSPKVVTNHPWMNIVHPGPWTQLPPAPAPVPLPRSKTVSNVRGAGNWLRTPPPNPFEEEEVEDTQGEAAKPESANQIKPSEAAVYSENSGDIYAVVCKGNAKNPSVESEKNAVKPADKRCHPHFKEGGGDAAPEMAKEATAMTNMLKASGELSGDGSQVASVAITEAQSHILPRSLSVPAITAEPSQSNSASVELTSCQSKTARRENPFDRKLEMSKSKTFQDLSSGRGPAPGHGFPLVKRKVKAEQDVSMEELQVQMRELHTQLETLEQRGIELEKTLRVCKKDKEEEQMLTEWFALMHERHILSRKDTELVYLTKQQKLEDRQADVEYELRCLLNKPESDWSQEDRGREQQLMDELVAIIEQRNQIVSSLDQDRQREREEDLLWEGTVRNKDLKEGPKEPKKSKGKFKPAKVFKMLNHKTESSKDSVEKKS
ncbi:MICAL-like protein 1 isoform X3 [Leuresthes tenuis]|uniref:MICAL-like protein 1 isoform X3 n=1 Tax=Leuresthes tenuis TaxID=355514 RepID=UPI003B5078EE